MVKKLFALASVTALTGLMAAVAASGCSSTKTEDVTPEAGSSSGGDAKADVKKDVDPEPEAGAPTCPKGSATDQITAADIDAQLKWAPPLAIQNVCTQADIDKLKALFAKAAPGAGVKFADMKTELGAACSACAFSPIKNANWQVFVEDTSGAIDNRTGSCLAQVVNAECGKATFQVDTCLDSACTEADCGAAAVQACYSKAAKGACKDLVGAFQKACPDQDVVTSCGNIFTAIAVSCAGGPDAGIDASTK